jgi:putative YphP/YqiW family bacilliredoxin
VFLFRGGKAVFALHRHQIENRGAAEIATALRQAFNEHCTKSAAE